MRNPCTSRFSGAFKFSWLAAATLMAGCGGGESAQPAGTDSTPRANVSQSTGDQPETWQSSTYYFSDCQEGAGAGCVPGDNANPGTTPGTARRTLEGINVNALPAGTQLLFKRGGAWNWTTTVRLDNRNTSAASPLTFGAYGNGAAPVLRVSSNFGFETGEWNNTVPDGGYVFRGLRFLGLDTAPPDVKAIWLRGTVSDVVIDDVEITNFAIGLYGQGHDDIQRVTVRNSRFIRNKSMGVLGTFNNSVFEGNLFEGNNFMKATTSGGQASSMGLT